MDDLNLLSTFREDVPPPDSGTQRRARAALMSTIQGEPHQPMRLHRPSRRWPVAVGVAAAAVALAVAVPSILPSGRGRGGAQPAAAAALLRASKVASRQTGEPAPVPGQFVYTKTQSGQESDWADAGPNHEGFSALVPLTREAWIGTDGSGRLMETRGTPEFLSDQDEATWEAAGRPDLGGNDTEDQSFQAGGLYYFDLSSLPTDPDQLQTMIEERQVEGGPPGDAETFAIIGDMLRETYATPLLRAALYQIASELPGIELLGSVKDPVGRDGIAVAYTSGGDQHQLIFDPDTSALLGERSVVVDPGEARLDVEPGTVVSWAAYLASGVVDSTSQRP